MAVAVFNTDAVVGEAVAEGLEGGGGVRLRARFSVLPPGRHGFHIHRAGDLRGEGCAGACDHWHTGRTGTRHGGAPGSATTASRHTGDLGNVVAGRSYTYELHGVRASDLWGRSLIVLCTVLTHYKEMLGPFLRHPNNQWITLNYYYYVNVCDDKASSIISTTMASVALFVLNNDNFGSTGIIPCS